jgi:hypothetical protein
MDFQRTLNCTKHAGVIVDNNYEFAIGHMPLSYVRSLFTLRERRIVNA